MRISLLLNSTMDKSFVRPHKSDWFQQEQRQYTHSSQGMKQEQRSHTHPSQGFKKEPRPYFLHQVRQEFGLNDSTTSGKQTSTLKSITAHANHNRHFPDLLDTSYEIKWLFHTLTALSLALESAVSQFGALVLLAVTLLLLFAQITGLVLILSSATTLPLGFQFMLAAVGVISVTVFKLMY